MELFVGPALALIGSMCFTVVSAKGHSKEITELQSKVELLEASTVKNDDAVLNKAIQTIIPVAKAVQELQVTIGK